MPEAAPTPAVSVCLPTYNYAEFIGQAVQSVLDQNFADFELLIFDDASTDNTAEVLRPFLSDPRVKFVQHAQNQGLFANFNLSAEAARGKYVKYLCADDWLDRRFLEKTVPLLEADESLVLATTANWLVDGENELTGEQFAPFGDSGVVPARKAATELARWGNVIGMPTNALIRRDALLDIGGFDARFAPAADIHLWLKLLARGDVGWLREQLCFIRVHSRHSHNYGPDPSESTFLVWEDARNMPNPPVDAKIVRSGLNFEARRSLMYVGTHLAGRRMDRAKEIWNFTAKHVGMAGEVLRFALGSPAILFAQASRVFALKTGRMVVYTPAPRVGEKLEAARPKAFPPPQ